MFGEEKELSSSSELVPVIKPVENKNKKIKITFTIDCIEVKTNEVNTGATKIENCTQAEEESARLLNWEDSTASIKIEGCDGDEVPLDLNTIEPLKQFAKEGLSYMYLKNGFISKDTYGLSDFLNAFIENKDNTEKREKYLAVAKEIFDNATKDADDSKPFVKEIKAKESELREAFDKKFDGVASLTQAKLDKVSGAKFIQLLYDIVNKGAGTDADKGAGTDTGNDADKGAGTGTGNDEDNDEEGNNLIENVIKPIENLDPKLPPEPLSNPVSNPTSAGPDNLVATVLQPTGKPTVIQRRASVQGPGPDAGTSTTIPSAVGRRGSLPPGFGTGRDREVQSLSKNQAKINNGPMGQIISQRGGSMPGGNRTRRYQSKKKRFTRRHNFH